MRMLRIGRAAPMAAVGPIFAVAAAVQGAVFVPVTNDADSGISAAKTYTHAIDYGSAPAATVNGVAFTAEDAGAGGTFSAAGESATAGNTGNIGATGSIVQLYDDFAFSSGQAAGNSETITLTGLTVGQQYDVRLYTRTWDPGDDRTVDISFNAGAGPVDSIAFDQDRLGNYRPAGSPA